MTKFLATGVVLAVLPMAAGAQVYDLGEITVTANQSEVEVARTGATVEVVTEEDLRASGDTKLAEYLATLPGVSMTANGGLGGTSTIRLRGLNGAYVPVLIDGIDVTDPSQTQTQYDWGSMTLSGISRVEVLKGSQSAIYGADAVGGVINITTLRAKEEGTVAQTSLEAGSFGTVQAGMSVATKGARGALSFGASHVKSDGFSATSAGTEADGYKATQLTFAAAYDATDSLRLGLSGYYLKSEGDFDEFGGDGAAPFDEVNTAETRALRAYAEFTTGAVDSTLSVSTFKTDRVSSSNGTDSPFTGERQKLDYKGVWQVSDALTLSFGADVTKESFTAVETDFSAWPVITTVNTADSVRTTGVFAEALYAASPNVDLALSLRYDDNSAFGDHLSGRAAMSWRIREDLILRAVASNGFRAPSLYELNSAIYGNPLLTPETSNSFELGLEKQFNGSDFVKATLFYTEIQDMIQYDFVTSSYGQLGGQSKTKGLELSGRFAVSERVGLFGSYTLTEATGPSGAPLVRVPKHDLVVGVEADLGDRFKGALTVNHVAGRPDDGFPAVAMGDYTLVNANVTYKLSDKAEAYLRIENLTNEKYESVPGFNTSGRAAYFGVRASF